MLEPERLSRQVAQTPDFLGRRVTHESPWKKKQCLKEEAQDK